MLERGSVEGEIFHRGAVQALAPEETQVTTRLAALVRHQLVRPDRAQLAGDDGYRFRHLLIRDAAYDALPKAVRADLHARFADWLDEHGDALVERDEIVGYHLEQAAGYRRARTARSGLSPNVPPRGSPPRGQTRGRPPGLSGALALLTRAVELLRPIGSTSRSSSRRLAHERRGRPSGGRSSRRCSESSRTRRRSLRGPACTCDGGDPRSGAGDVLPGEEAEELCDRALPAEETRGDARRLALLWELVSVAAQHRMRNDAAVEAAARGMGYQRLGGGASMSDIFDWALILGTRSAEEGLRMLDELAESRPPGAGDLSCAVHLAMTGRFDEAWALGQAHADHLHEVTGSAGEGASFLAMVASIEGDRERACRHYRDLLAAIPSGSESIAASYELPLARDLCYLGRYEEVQPLLHHARSVPQGPALRAMGSSVEALTLAARGQLVEAEASARNAVAVAADEMDNLWLEAWAHEDLATVLERAGRIDDAREELQRAVMIWERKGCLPCADRIRAQIDSLGPGLTGRAQSIPESR